MKNKIERYLIDNFNVNVDKYKVSFDLNIPIGTLQPYLDELVKNEFKVNGKKLITRFYIECENVECKSPIYVENNYNDTTIYCLHCDTENTFDGNHLKNVYKFRK